MSAPGPTMMERREKARRLATGIVAIAMGFAGLTLVALAVALAWMGKGGLLFLALIVGALGLALAAAGFFFQLVPLRVDELAEEKRAYDRRTRGER